MSIAQKVFNMAAKNEADKLEAARLEEERKEKEWQTQLGQMQERAAPLIEVLDALKGMGKGQGKRQVHYAVASDRRDKKMGVLIGYVRDEDKAYVAKMQLSGLKSCISYDEETWGLAASSMYIEFSVDDDTTMTTVARKISEELEAKASAYNVLNFVKNDDTYRAPNTYKVGQAWPTAWIETVMSTWIQKTMHDHPQFKQTVREEVAKMRGEQTPEPASEAETVKEETQPEPVSAPRKDKRGWFGLGGN